MEVKVGIYENCIGNKIKILKIRDDIVYFRRVRKNSRREGIMDTIYLHSMCNLLKEYRYRLISEVEGEWD